MKRTMFDTNKYLKELYIFICVFFFWKIKHGNKLSRQENNGKKTVRVHHLINWQGALICWGTRSIAWNNEVTRGLWYLRCPSLSCQRVTCYSEDVQLWVTQYRPLFILGSMATPVLMTRSISFERRHKHRQWIWYKNKFVSRNDMTIYFKTLIHFITASKLKSKVMWSGSSLWLSLMPH